MVTGNTIGVAASQTDDSKYKAHDAILKYLVSMSLKAAIELGIPDILDKAEGGKPLTAADILAEIPAKSSQPAPELIKKIERILRLLVWEGLFTLSLNEKNQPAYGPTNISRCFVKENDLNMLVQADFAFNDVLLKTFSHMSASILEDAGNPVEKVVGMPLYEYCNTDPEFGQMFLNLMVTTSKWEFDNVLDSLQRSGVLEGVETLVDVGGGSGSNVAAIMAKYPHLKGINFDLPHVIAKAPVVEGLTHIGGDMFESLPSGDAMLLKWILHNNDDKSSITILRNCYTALPEQGKVLIQEYVLLDDTNRSPKARVGINFDLVMLVLFKAAKERAKGEYEKIIEAAGFSRSEFIQQPGSMDLIIAFKNC